MIIILSTEPFIIKFNLIDIVSLDKKQDVYKFSLSFTHHVTEKITFSLPKDYQTYLYTNDIEKLITFLSNKIHQLNEHGEDEFFLDFENSGFVNSESDISIIVDSGEYYPKEDNGLLHLKFFFNINVAYKESGTTNIGFEAHTEINAMKKFINDLRILIKKI